MVRSIAFLLPAFATAQQHVLNAVQQIHPQQPLEQPAWANKMQQLDSTQQAWPIAWQNQWQQSFQQPQSFLQPLPQGGAGSQFTQPDKTTQVVNGQVEEHEPSEHQVQSQSEHKVQNSNTAAAYTFNWAQCPRALNTSTWLERVRAKTQVWWDSKITQNDLAWAMHRHGVLQGQDDMGHWFYIVIRGRNADGTFHGVVYNHKGKSNPSLDDDPPPVDRRLHSLLYKDSDGEPWPIMYPEFMRMRREQKPTHPWTKQRYSGCGYWPAACTLTLPPTEVARIDQQCAASLPAAFWSALTRPQVYALPQALLDPSWGLSAESCRHLGAEAASRLHCDREIADSCVHGLTVATLKGLSASCVSHISVNAISVMPGLKVAALFHGVGKLGLRKEQMAGITPAACNDVTSSWVPFMQMGSHGDDLCAALPPTCWQVDSESKAKIPDVATLPRNCLTRLAPAALYSLTSRLAAQKEGHDAVKMCNQGEETLTVDMSAEQRRALHPVMCPACLIRWGGPNGGDLFPQCGHAVQQRTNLRGTTARMVAEHQQPEYESF